MQELFALATVAAKYTDGLTLTFDGQSEASAKHYKCNRGMTFGVSDRVLCLRVSGTWIVLCTFGAPK